MKNIFVFVMIFGSLTEAYGQLDDEGWTVIRTETVDKVLYISANGNDDNAITYPFPHAHIGADPQTPVEEIKPFRTLDAAHAQVLEDETVWILFKRGDTFYYGIEPLTGVSSDAPHVYSYYGTAGDLPLFKVGSSTGIIACCAGGGNFSVIGLSFYAHTRNPYDEDYMGAERSLGINFFVGEGHSFRNVLIEGCSFSYFANSSIQGRDKNRMNGVFNIALRRNLFFDNYATEGHSAGLFTAEVQQFLLEENVFDHNGWLIQSINGDQDPSMGQATFFNHNTYFAEASNVSFLGNSFLRASSIGTKWISGRQNNADSIKIKNNFYYAGEVGISIGGNDNQDPYRFNSIDIQENVFDAIGTTRPTNRDLAWYITVEDWDNGILSHNIFTNQNDPDVNNVFGVLFRGESRNVSVEKNILYDLNNGSGFILESNEFDNILIRGNELQYELQEDRHFVHILNSPLAEFSENTYFNSDNDQDDDFHVNGVNYNFSDWSREFDDENSTFKELNYVDPSRNLNNYVIEVLGLSGLDEYFSEMKNQSPLNWRSEYTATEVNRWIRAGFEKVNTTSLKDVSIDAHVYPNPAGNKIYIELDSQEGFHVNLYNVYGSLIKSNTNVHQMDINGVPKGVYLLEIRDLASGKKFVKKILCTGE